MGDRRWEKSLDNFSFLIRLNSLCYVRRASGAEYQKGENDQLC
jgi:hypothetical protein